MMLLDNIKKSNLIKKNQNILVGVSGGADSMALISALNSIKKEYNLVLEVAHINHLLRGKESDDDEEFVRKYCLDNELKIHVKRINMNEFAFENKLSKEEAGREIRYNFFNEIISEKENPDSWNIALAHNLDDQVETILMRIIRGTGLRGMEGILPRSVNIIRPLLCLHRTEIEKYLLEISQKFRIDSSNNSNDYTRNKIRNVLIPLIKRDFNSNFDQSILKFREYILDTNLFVDEKMKQLSQDLIFEKNEYKTIFYLDRFSLQSDYIKINLLRNEILRINKNLISFDKKHFDEFISIIKSKGYKKVEIKNIICYKNNNSYVISKKFENNLDFDFETDVENELKSVEFNGFKISFVKNKFMNGFYHINTESKNILIRKRKKGDKIYINSKNRKLKDFFIDKKIPNEERDFVPIVEIDKEIKLVSQIYKKRDSFDEKKDFIAIKMEELWTI